MNERNPGTNSPDSQKHLSGWSKLESGIIVPDSIAKQGVVESTTAMTRDERIADGKERVDALKSKAQVGLGKMLRGLKDHFYIGVSRGAELPGQVKAGAEPTKNFAIEKGGGAKEKGRQGKEFAAKTWGVAREKAEELFGNGRDFISQKAQESRERKAARQQRRLERKETKQVARDERVAELDSRQAERANNKLARQKSEAIRSAEDIADKISDEYDRTWAERYQGIASEADREFHEINKRVAAAIEQENTARMKAEKVAEEAEEARRKAEENPSDEGLRLEAKEKAGLSTVFNARLERASLEVENLRAEAYRQAVRAGRAEKIVKDAQERIESRLRQAETRKAERVAARREARGDAWESAKDRVKRAADDDPNWMKRFGAKVAISSGRLARKVADSLVSMGYSLAEDKREAAVAEGSQAA